MSVDAIRILADLEESLKADDDCLKQDVMCVALIILFAFPPFLSLPWRKGVHE